MRRIASLALALTAAACGSNASGPSDMAMPDMAAPVVAITATTDFVGFPTQLDGSGSTGSEALTYLWRVLEVPRGSAVTDASLSSTGDPRPTLEPDRGGHYVIELTVSAGELSAKGTIALDVPTWPIYYFGSASTGGSSTWTVGASVIRSDGTGSHPVICTSSSMLPEFAGNPSAATLLAASFAFIGMRTFEPVPPSPPLPPLPALPFAVVPEPANGLSGAPHLTVVDSDSSCDHPANPVRLDVDAVSSTVYKKGQALGARFSPDGTRAVFLMAVQPIDTEDHTAWLVITRGVDGANPRVVQRFTGALPPVGVPAWMSNGRLAIVAKTASDPVRHGIVEVDDVEGTDPVKTVDCGTSFKRVAQTEYAGGFFFLTATPSTPSDAPSGVYRMEENVCNAAQMLSKETRPGGVAGDFSLSPDGTKLLFVSTEESDVSDAEGALETDIFLAPSDGSGSATRLVGSPGMTSLGPRWITGGRQIVWTQMISRATDASTSPAESSVWLANADGSKAHALLAAANTPISQQAFIGGTSLSGCDAQLGDQANGPSLALAVLLGALLMGLGRRRAETAPPTRR